jgi:hypothetical protein
MEVCGQQPLSRAAIGVSPSLRTRFAAAARRLQWNLGADIALRKQYSKDRPPK